MSSHILGIATAFPAIVHTVDDTDAFFTKWGAPSQSLDTTLKINRSTRIQKRHHVLAMNDPIVNQATPPSISEANAIFMDKGLKLAVEAGEKALKDWGGSRADITHLVCTTCTSSSHPGFDYDVLTKLGLDCSTDRTLLHGVGCAGGLSALRLAHQLCNTTDGKRPRVLVIAAEVTSTFVRSELEELGKRKRDPNVGVCLFSDGASAMIVGRNPTAREHASFEVIKTLTQTIPDTAMDLRYNVDQYGWKAVISPQVPIVTSNAVPAVYKKLLATAPKTGYSFLSEKAVDTPAPSLDWLVHPGGAAILARIEKGLSLSPMDHTRASWDVYIKRGNTSSVSIGAVIEKSREMGGREGCVAVAFGPGVTIEACLLKRTSKSRASTGVKRMRLK